MKKLDTEGSKRLYEEAQKYLLNGMASYFHKSDVEEYPICITHGSGSKVYDVDGNEYIDYVGGLGPMLLGYQPQEVLEAVSRQLDKVRKLTQETGVVLIFDEVITGFRLALGGAQEYFGVTPDLAVFAKAVTAGFPLSVVAGKKEIMESGAKASGTFNGNPVVTAAAMAALGIYQKKETYEHLQSIGELFVEGIQELSGKYGIPMYAGAYGGMVQWTVGMDRTPVDFRDWLKNSDVELYNRIFLRARDYGVRFTDRRGRVCLTTEHTGADIRRTMEVLDLVLSEIAKEA